jgi:predicted dehydrogenase
MNLNVGIIGCGHIAPKYLRGCADFPGVIQVMACADIIEERAQQFAAAHQLTAYTVDELLQNPEIDIIINLTIPTAHAAVSLQVIEAGKHVYSEKPLALTREDGRKILAAAEQAGVRVGCAPDTFLGGGGQTARQVIDSGIIGEPVAAVTFMANHGHESWHPNPAFYYTAGGGPMFDMGPYYLTALVNLLGSMVRVTGSSKRSFEERIAGHPSINGQVIPVSVTTHQTGNVTFENGAIATVITSFDIWRHNLPVIEVYGTEGSLSVPDPNTFSGDVRVWQQQTREWHSVPLIARADGQRGMGVADMARSIMNDEPHRASGNLAYHVLDAMAAFDESSECRRAIELESRALRPASLAESV